ncbi:MAG: hypothetical protein HYV32_06050 [Candidatus Kerfeldbacteria bacterium]|nr:hypothetical protein [Candidatus Kerfeldbacteria bacterium]
MSGKIKKVYIIPGFTHTAKHAGYSSIQRYCRKRGVDAQVVHIDWKNKTMSDYVEQFLEQYEKQSKTAVLGFSFGAMIATIAQQYAQADRLLLCSLSPYFKEDISKLKPAWKKSIGKNRVNNFQKHSFTAIAKQITAKTDIIAGDKEGREVMHRASQAHTFIKKSVLHVLPGVKHDIADKHYQQKIQQIITEMTQ